MANLFTYNVHNHNVYHGLPLTVGQPGRKPREIRQPYLACGHGFVAINNRWGDPPIEDDMLMSGSLEWVKPMGREPFPTFSRPKTADTDTLLFIETAMPARFKSRVDLNEINAYAGVYGHGFNIVKGDRITGAALLRCDQDATIQIFLPDGRVEVLLIKNGQPQHISQTYKQMAGLRVAQFEQQLERSANNERRQHGILGGVVRLLQVTKDVAAVDVLVDFLAEHIAELTRPMRQDVRVRLLNLEHPYAATFLDGYEGSNVVRIETAEGAAKRAAADKKKKERAEADRRLRDKMRGDNSEHKRTSK